MSKPVKGLTAPSIVPIAKDETPSQPSSQDSLLLNMPLDIIAQIGSSYLSSSASSRFSRTCTTALPYAACIEAQMKHELKIEVDQFFTYAKKHFATPVQTCRQETFRAIEDLTLQNAEKTKDTIKIFLLRYLLKLSDSEADVLHIASHGEIPTYNRENPWGISVSQADAVRTPTQREISMYHMESRFLNVVEIRCQARQLEQFADPYQRFEGHQNTSVHLIEDKHFAEATEVANAIPHDERRNRTLTAIDLERCRVLSSQQRFEEAAKIGTFPHIRMETVKMIICNEHLKHGRIAKAFEIA